MIKASENGIKRIRFPDNQDMPINLEVRNITMVDEICSFELFDDSNESLHAQVQ